MVVAFFVCFFTFKVLSMLCCRSPQFQNRGDLDASEKTRRSRLVVFFVDF